ncbi:outer membrane beta-barrel protein [Rubinisphaera sp.]|uniref:outer membrane beta-barrel protein n=1 Tax=Rubinisphaera sp. TaxID=2024857 RepID=UPI0025F3E5FE|nr:outer membrane beta-barrel protein [Rubinisphaera sp.]
MMLLTPKSWKVLSAFLIAAGMSFGTTSSAQAGDCCYDSCCEPDCVFDSAGDRLCGRLKSMCGLWSCGDSCVDDCCIDDCIDDSCCIDDGCTGCCDEGSGWTVGGWAQVGYHTRDNGQFNNNQDRINAQQNWLYVEKVADGSCGWDFGGRFDIMYGTDANDTQAFGNGRARWDFDNGANITNGYGWALPQAYAEAAYGDWSIIAGHFYTLLGYEVVTAPDNFFYSHAFTMYRSEAFTHTGVLATHQASDNVTNYYGYTFGWDTGFDRNAGGGNFLGGSSIALSDNTSLTYITTFGDLGGPGARYGNGNGTGYSHSLVFDHTFGCCDKWNYVAQTDYIDATNYNPLGLGVTETYGLNQYLTYSMTEKVAVGSRFEWWRANSQDVYSLTTGANFRPTDNIVIRPEVRYYFGSDGAATALNTGGTASTGNHLLDTWVFGVDAILTF